jgi:hypothetical protein
MGRLAPKGEFDMLYAVRKRRGRWTICSDDNVVLQFETYDEAVATVRGAVAVLAQRSNAHEVPPHEAPRHAADGHSISPCAGDGGTTTPLTPSVSRDDGAQNAAVASGS